jgi:tetratricopeptide (TPR) repeat protein
VSDSEPTGFDSDSHLDRAGDSLPLTTAERVDATCDAFEAAWRAGLRPRIEAYLAGTSGPVRSALLRELLAAELELQREEGFSPATEDYHERFPADTAAIAMVFARREIEDSLPPPPVRSRTGETVAGPFHHVLLRATETGDKAPAVRADSLEIPRVGRFQLFGEIARGGMGAVFMGRDVDLGRDLAVKVLLEQHRDRPEFVRRFVEEAQIGGQLQHPGVVPVYELGGFADRRPFFAMKLVKGETLAALLKGRNGPSDDPARFLGIFAQVCQTVAYAHARGVIHRDLKPANIMVGRFGEVQVMDWGLAKVLKNRVDGVCEPEDVQPADLTTVRTLRSGSAGSASLVGNVLGTPAYMAPEQAAGEIDVVDERADVFGLGSILCTILTGEPAYTGRTSREVLHKARRGDTGDVLARLDASGAEADLLELAGACLAVDPCDRPRDAGVVVERVTAHIRGVQERLRSAELARVDAQARAEEALRTADAAKAKARAERRALLTALTLAGSLLVAAIWINGARREERAARARAVEALAAERVAKVEAEENFQTARRAVQDYLTTVSESTLLKQQNRADLRALRKQLLEGALAYYQGFIKRRASDPRLQSDLADAYYRVGTITSEIGSKAEALPAHQRALEIRQRLAAADPADVRRQEDLGMSHNNIGIIQKDTGRPREAMRSYENALAIYGKLAAAHSEDLGHQSQESNFLNNLGVLEAEVGLLDEGLKSHARALAIRRRLVDAKPAVLLYQRNLGESYLNLGVAQRQTGRFDDALSSFESAAAIRRRLTEANPEVAQYQSDLGNVLNNIGLIHFEAGRPAEALKWQAQAIEVRTRLAEANPSVTRYQRDLAQSHLNIGSVQSEDDGMRSLGRAIDILGRLADANPEVTGYRTDLASGLSNLGGLQRRAGRLADAMLSVAHAIEILRALVVANPTVTAYRNNLALALQNLGDAQSDADRPEEAARSLAEAVENFRRLAESNPRAIPYRLGLAESLHALGFVELGSGQTTKAVPHLQDALGIWEASELRPEDLLVKAYTLAQLGALAGPGARGDELADRAMRALGQAVEGGCRESNLTLLRYLEPLRSRPGFLLLYMDLTFPEDPFTR